MRIYVAAPLSQSHVACLLATALLSAGHTIASHWHAIVVPGSTDPVDHKTRRECLADNLSDLTRCDLVVAWTAVGVPRATLCEIAWALASGKRVVWIQGAAGEGACLFDADPGVTIVREHSDAAVLRAIGIACAAREAA